MGGLGSSSASSRGGLGSVILSLLPNNEWVKRRLVEDCLEISPQRCQYWIKRLGLETTRVDRWQYVKKNEKN